MTAMPVVHDCTVSTCSYNHDGCHAYAVTITRDASCGTFIPLDAKGGLARAVPQVGACQRQDCLHNNALECSADAVRVGSESADCLTFTVR